MTTSCSSFPFQHPLTGSNVNFLYARGASTVIGRIRTIEVGWARRIRLHVELAVGDVVLHGNQDSIPATFKAGDWVRVSFLRTYPDGHDGICLSVLTVVRAREDQATSWVPKALCHRDGTLRRLTSLLNGLAPALQGAFIVALSDAQVQRRFFWNVAALDHHCYPGGLLDQSVSAAELVAAQAMPEETCRSVAILSALVFDLGKAFQSQVSFDRPRTRRPLAPHSATEFRLRRAYEVLARLDPHAGELLLAVLKSNPGSAIGGPPEVAAITQLVRQAVTSSWSK